MALGLGSAIIMVGVFFSIKQTKMYNLQVRYILSKHNLEKANGMDGWMDGKHLTAEKKGAFIRLTGSNLMCNDNFWHAHNRRTSC